MKLFNNREAERKLEERVKILEKEIGADEKKQSDSSSSNPYDRIMSYWISEWSSPSLKSRLSYLEKGQKETRKTLDLLISFLSLERVAKDMKVDGKSDTAEYFRVKSKKVGRPKKIKRGRPKKVEEEDEEDDW